MFKNAILLEEGDFGLALPGRPEWATPAKTSKAFLIAASMVSTALVVAIRERQNPVHTSGLKTLLRFIRLHT
jgi:hypothetical protein